jgi:hypothetical protein
MKRDVVAHTTAPMWIANVRTFRILVVQGCCCYWEGGGRSGDCGAEPTAVRPLSFDPASHMVIRISEVEGNLQELVRILSIALGRTFRCVPFE